MSSSDTSACVGSFKVVVDRIGTNNETLILLDFTDLSTFVEWASGRAAVGEVVSDLGDAAFLGPKGTGPYSSLCVRSGSRAIRIACGTSGGDISPETLQQIAELVLSRIESGTS